MSYTVGYYLALLIEALGKLAWLGFIVSLISAAYLFVRGKMLAEQQKPSDEPLGSLIDWTDGGKMARRGLVVLFAVAPLLYLLACILPASRVAMTHMGFPQDEPACMTGDETGELIAGHSSEDTSWFSFRMQDGVAVMCRVDGMRAAGTRRAIYRVYQGKRVS